MPHVAYGESAPEVNLQAEEEGEYDYEYPRVVLRFQHHREAAQTIQKLRDKTHTYGLGWSGCTIDSMTRSAKSIDQSPAAGVVTPYPEIAVTATNKAIVVVETIQNLKKNGTVQIFFSSIKNLIHVMLL